MLELMFLAATTCGVADVPVTALPVEARARLGALQQANPCTVEGLPEPLGEALRRILKEERLTMANPHEEWNHGCLLVPGLARRQLVFAGHSGSTWLIHFQEGGYAIVPRTVVLTIKDDEVTVEWSGSCYQELPDPNSLGAPVGNPRRRWRCDSIGSAAQQ